MDADCQGDPAGASESYEPPGNLFCGLGSELVLLLPVLFWRLRSRGATRPGRS